MQELQSLGGPPGGAIQLRVRDFDAALKGFVSTTLRGLSLTLNGVIDFSHVGGMTETKKMLKETILWPSRVSPLYYNIIYI